MLDTPAFRLAAADKLAAAAGKVPPLTAFVGLDGFVDEILHVVNKRYDAVRFDRVATITDYAARLGAAAGQSTNVELVNTMTKLGGNGPIMANALASLGLAVTYLGALGHPVIHPVFAAFQKRATVHSISGPGYTDALEFEDGKLMIGKHYTLKDVTWDNICERFGRKEFANQLGSADLVGFVNWTMLPYMSDIWSAVHREILPHLSGPRRKMFFDLADPEKRTATDIRDALNLISQFQSAFDVILGLNEKEALEIGRVLHLPAPTPGWQGLADLAIGIQKQLGIDTVVVHPVTYALAVSNGRAEVVAGPICQNPKITTGAGDHFNSGFCLAKLLGLDNASAVLCGVANSGHYVRTAESPNVADLIHLIRNWPNT